MGRTIGEHLKHLANEHPSKDIFVFYDADLKKSSITFKQLHTLASRFAHILREKGIRHGQSVCVSLPTSVELAVAFYGAMLAGARAVSCEVIMDKAQVFHHCINKSEAELLVVRTEPSDVTWGTIRDNVAQFTRDATVARIHDPAMPKLKTVLIANRPDENNDVQGFLAMLRSYRATYEDTESEDTDTCSLWLTSGTTGMPKLVMKSHRSFTDACVVEGGFFKISKRNFSNSPWSWAVSSPFDVMNGSTRVQPELWTKPKDYEKHLADILKTDPVKAAFLTPTEMEGILKHWNLKERKIADAFLVGGYPISQAMCEWFLTMTNKVVIRYACSELLTISLNIISDISQYKDFDNGKLCEGTAIKAVNHKMEEVPRGTPGRLVIDSVGVFSGYMNDPDKSSEALTDDGWYLTSDAGYIDADDHLIVVGRYDYIIMHNNLHIYPSTIEKPIQRLKGVKTVVVVPVPDDHNYHNICACVVLEPGSNLKESDVIQAVTDKYTDEEMKHVVAPQHVLFMDDIKVNERGKMNTNSIIEYAKKMVKNSK